MESTRENDADEDQGLFYPVILARQLVRMFAAIGLIFVVIMACYAELQETGSRYFGENGKYLTLGFVVFLNAGGLSLLWRFHDLIEEIKRGERLKNLYTVVQSLLLAVSTYGLLNYQYQNMHGEGAHSFLRALLKIVIS
ncbi:MAG: hypothetical protein Q9M29_00945 [Mariprofundaceae bacterium]|nr:hypothetical protein [Mariprofundaceae bacterium]